MSLDNFQKLLFFTVLQMYTNGETPYCYWIDELVNMTILQFVQRSLNLKLTFWVDHTPPISIIIQHTTLQDWPVPLPYNSLSCHWSMFYLHFEGSRILFTKFFIPNVISWKIMSKYLHRLMNMKVILCDFMNFRPMNSSFVKSQTALVCFFFRCFFFWGGGSEFLVKVLY